MRSFPVAADVFTSTPDTRLIGGRHRQSQRLVFPLPGDDAYDAVELPRFGVLWSYTIQRFAPKSPPYRGSDSFEPFALGYVELPDALIVEGRLTDVAFESLRVGMAMEVTTVDFAVTPDGDRIHTFAFRPRASTSR